MNWQSYHLFLPENRVAATDAFLTEELYPELQRQEEKGSLRRFFFIRYSEGGLHLRLRLLPAFDVPRAAESLERQIDRCATAHGARLETHVYDRAGHYFGETPESVYAELLNITTSKLSLALLQTFGAEQRGSRWIALTCVLGLILIDSRERSQWALALNEGRVLALRAARTTGLGPKIVEEGSGLSWSAAVEAAWPRVDAGIPSALYRPTVALIRRVRRRGPKGCRVATHALHLLFNKTGFSLAEEYEAFSTLARIRYFREEQS